jgi:cellulose synthase/poly-beta-1,6-N-acetylglucosamine synthase-like glycosyltransferase
MIQDCRLDAPTWHAGDPGRAPRVRATLLALASTVALALYFGWLLQPGRVGNPALFALLIVAELFNVAQAIGFWWTCLATHRRRPPGTGKIAMPDVDVFIPTYSEQVEVVEATVAAATRMHGARVRVALLDDGNRQEMVELAHRHGIRYVRRTLHEGAKAGNINHALGRTDAPYVLVLDCDHVPHPDLLVRTLPEFADDTVAFVQTPQYYANAASGRIAAASWSQQALFFGPIARGKDAHQAMFCCGTNVIFRRRALEVVGGFPSGSLTEDFAISLELHERGWRSVYVPEVLASGLGPEDLASYVSQQHRWARGCIGMIPRVLAADLPLRHKLQYLLSASYFLTGWTVLVYLSLPAIRILTGAQPVAGAAADSFLAAFGPYFALSIATVASVGAGQYTFAAYSLATSTFWIHVHATYRTLRGRAGSFVVTPKQGTNARQLGPAAPTLVVIALLAAVAVYGLSQGRDAATLNNVALAAVHMAILGHGVAAAVAPTLAATANTSVDAIDGADEVAA